MAGIGFVTNYFFRVSGAAVTRDGEVQTVLLQQFIFPAKASLKVSSHGQRKCSQIAQVGWLLHSCHHH